MKTYECINCGAICKHGYSKLNKFCSNVCQGEYKWKTETRLRVERGECTEAPTQRKYLIEVYGEVCSCCNTTALWQGKSLTLHVDHVDGNCDNNMPYNLRLLCPNCHSQTETYGSKGTGNRLRKITKRAAYNKQYRSTIQGRVV